MNLRLCSGAAWWRLDSTGHWHRRNDLRLYSLGVETHQELAKRLARQDRENQRSVRASLSVIVSTALPKGLVSFDRIEDVWVSALDCLVPLAKALRFTLYQTSVLQLASQDRGVKTERVYGYVSGEDFKQRVSSIMEGYVSLRSDLERERRSVTAAWAKREKSHDLVLMGTAGIYGDLHGILGKTLPLIEELEDPELPTILGSLQSPDAEVGAPL
jgi:hypothetical protein